MKKQIRAIIIATIVTCAIIISCAYAMPAQAESAELEHGEFYPKLTVVISSVRIDTGLWVIECQDMYGPSLMMKAYGQSEILQIFLCGIWEKMKKMMKS